MKARITLVLLAITTTMLAACADDEQPAPVDNNEQTAPNRPAPKETTTFSEPAPASPQPVNDFLNTPITTQDAGVGAIPPKQLPYEGE